MKTVERFLCYVMSVPALFAQIPVAGTFQFPLPNWQAVSAKPAFGFGAYNSAPNVAAHHLAQDTQIGLTPTGTKIYGSVAESMGETPYTPAFRRLLPFAFHGHSMEGWGGVKGSLRRAKTARP